MKPETNEMIWVTEKGKIKGLYVMGGSPSRSGPNLNKIKEVFEDMDFIVVQDLFLNETAEVADVVLPACSFAEKDGTFTNPARFIQRVRKAIDPIGESKPDWEIICELSKKMGYEMNYNHPSDIMDEIASLTPPYGGVSYERLENGGLRWPCPNKEHPGTEYLWKENLIRRVEKVSFSQQTMFHHQNQRTKNILLYSLLARTSIIFILVILDIQWHYTDYLPKTYWK